MYLYIYTLYAYVCMYVYVCNYVSTYASIFVCMYCVYTYPYTCYRYDYNSIYFYKPTVIKAL